MYTGSLRPQIGALDPYTPGLSIDEIRQKFGLAQIYKMASNENPLGVPPLAQEAIARHAQEAFRYPRGGNPRLVHALAELHKVSEKKLVIGNGSDEVIDLLIRMLCDPVSDSIVCFQPCFNLYPIQAQISGVTIKRCPLKEDFSFDFAGMLKAIDDTTRIVFLTTPDNPSGYCPVAKNVRAFAKQLEQKAPKALLLIDEAYMDFCQDEKAFSLLAQGDIPSNVGIMRTFSKSYGLAGLRLGYAILPEALAEGFWRARLPFSVNLLAEEAGLAALEDQAFREKTMETVRQGRTLLTERLTDMGCTVWPSAANFLLFTLPHPAKAADCFTTLLSHGIIIRLLKSYSLPDHLRVSIGNTQENGAFLKEMASFLGRIEK
ncbi:MAG: histidinol-phosphate transaminase [Desulfovibrio sp.]|nr:histidinol-phosphate transaminase [Desulfovibrio sp.]